MSNEINNNEAMEFGPDIMTLLDDEGNEHQFEVIDSLELDDERYMALIPVFDDAEELLDDDGELVILKVVEDNGEEFLEGLESEDEFNKVSAIFMERLEEDYDIIENDDSSIVQ